MLKAEYKINCPWGILHWYPENDEISCLILVLETGDILSLGRLKGRPNQLLLPYVTVQKAIDSLKNIASLSTRIKEALASVKVRHEPLIELCFFGGEPAVEMLETNPALAMLLAVEFKYDPARTLYEGASDLLCKRRHDILNYCSYHEGKWVVRLLSKIPPSQCSPYLLAKLNSILRSGDKKLIKILQHLKRVNSLVVDVMNDPELSAMVESSFYFDASIYLEESNNIEVYYLFRELSRLSGEVDQVKLSKVISLEDLQRNHNSYIEFLESSNCDYSNSIFSEPPIKPMEVKKDGMIFRITPLQTGKELYYEGSSMKHCIGSYARGILNGSHLYAYHVYAPNGEEATALLRKTANQWRLNEIRGFNNSEISMDTIIFVNSWLKEHNARIKEIADREQIEE